MLQKKYLELSLLADFDEDDSLGREDLRKLIDRLTGEMKLGESDMEQLIQAVSRSQNTRSAKIYIAFI